MRSSLIAAALLLAPPAERSPRKPAESDCDVAQLRAMVERMRSEHATRRASGSPAGTAAAPIRTRTCAPRRRPLLFPDHAAATATASSSSPTGRSPTSRRPAGGWSTATARPATPARQSRSSSSRRCRPATSIGHARRQRAARRRRLRRPASPTPRSTSCRDAPRGRGRRRDPARCSGCCCSRSEGQTVCTRYEGNARERLARPRLPARRPRCCPSSNDERRPDRRSSPPAPIEPARHRTPAAERRRLGLGAPARLRIGSSRQRARLRQSHSNGP